MNGEQLPRSEPDNEHMAHQNVPATMERTASRFQHFIIDGIAGAGERHEEIDVLTARSIAHVLGRAFGRASALADFGRTGEGSYETLRDEYLALYTDETTPAEIKEWINWFGTFLVQRDGTGSGRRFMNEHFPPKLQQLLVRTEVRVRGKKFTVHLPATLDRREIDGTGEELANLDLDLDRDEALQAFLSLPDVNANTPMLLEAFHEAFAGTYADHEAALRALSPLAEWENDLADWRIDHGITTEALEWNIAPLLSQLREVYDLVELNGWVHAFDK